MHAVSSLAATILTSHSAEATLSYLNLSKNNLGDKGVEMLCEALADYKHLHKLDLSHTGTTNEGGMAIRRLIENNHEIQEMNLQWNKIRGLGGIAIAQGLRINGGLKILNLSWNSLGSGKEGQFGEEWGKALAYENLVHLDLSFNKISKNDMLAIGESIKQNHKLLGFHIQGNQGCYLDSLGFIRETFEKPIC